MRLGFRSKGLSILWLSLAFSGVTSGQTNTSKKQVTTGECAIAPVDFEAAAIDPKRAKLTQAYEYWWPIPGGKERGIYLEHEVAKITFKGGKLTLDDPDSQVLTSYKIKGKKITVTFKSITQKSNGACPSPINILTLQTDDGKEFRLQIQIRSNRIDPISDSGEFGNWLMSHGPADPN